MNRIACRLGPATRGTTIFHGRPYHVNAFRHRAAFRCIHSGPNGETEGISSDTEASLLATEGQRDGVDGEPSLSKPKGNDQRAPNAIRKEVPSRSTKQDQPTSPIRLVRAIDRGWKAIPLTSKTGGKPGKATLSSSDNNGEKTLLRNVTSWDTANFVKKYERGRENLIHRLTKMKEAMRTVSPAHDIISRSYTLESEFPEQATKEDLLVAIKSRKFTARSWDFWARQAGRQAVVILFTPSFAAMVENDATLIPDILKGLTRKPSWTKGSPLEIDVVCACVDGLSPGPEMIPASVWKRPKEGFTILHGSESSTLSPLWNDNEVLPSRSPSMQSSITLRKGLAGPPDLTLPLANTLFKTGRLSTLLVSRWEYKTLEDEFLAIKGPVERTNATINLFQDLESALPKSFIPAIPLTPPRPIVNGLGNIVRTIDFGGEVGVGPASQELESTVTKYLEVAGYGKTTIDVWAMVVSPDGAKLGLPPLQPHQKALLSTTDKVQAKWQGGWDMKRESAYPGFWIHQGNAKFCRVLSGGGGWGAKQGLLSLDPQTTYSEVPEARFDFSGGTLEEQQTSALGNIAQEGAYIQFFVAHRGNDVNWQPFHQSQEYEFMMRKSAVFGAVPSTVDDIPTPAPEVGKEFAKPKYPFIVRRGHFGFVSESGMFLRHGPGPKPDEPPAPESFTKVDMPYSYFYRDYKNKSVDRPRPIARQVGSARKTLIRQVGIDSNIPDEHANLSGGRISS